MKIQTKFKELQFVEISGTATGYGDLIGCIISIELSNITKEPFYHVRVYNAPIDTVYVAEKFLSETSQDKLGFINDPKMLE